MQTTHRLGESVFDCQSQARERDVDPDKDNLPQT